jgi:hypothetical protein
VHVVSQKQKPLVTSSLRSLTSAGKLGDAKSGSDLTLRKISIPAARILHLCQHGSHSPGRRGSLCSSDAHKHTISYTPKVAVTTIAPPWDHIT